MSLSKLLIVNADDFGFTPDVNDGILEAHRNGILTATTLMAGGAAFEHAVQLARLNPSLDVGCHLIFIGGNSLLVSAAPSRLSPPASDVVRRRIRVYDEFVAQVRRILDSGVALTHLDTHKHTLMLPGG